MSPEKLARFKEELEKRIAEMGQRQAMNAPAGFTGEAIAAPLEHTVRIHFLDHLLKALRWKMEAVVEEARVKQDTTLFLDYLGVHLQQRIPILIFEAKAWDKPLVNAISAAYRKDTTDILLAKALNFIRDGQGETPVTAEWTECFRRSVPTFAIFILKAGTSSPRLLFPPANGWLFSRIRETLSSIMVQSIHGLFWFIDRSNLSPGRPTSSDNSLTMPS
jgi:hypothetical protein